MGTHIGIVYAITASISLTLILLVYARVLLTRQKETIEIAFVWVLRFCALFCLVDALWGIFYAGIINSHNGLIAITYGYHLLASASAFVWMAYIIQLTSPNKKITRVLVGLSVLLLMSQFSLIVLNTRTHLVFYVDENNEYISSTYRFLIYFLQYAYYVIILISSTILYFVSTQSEKIKYKVAILFSIPPIFFGMGQLIFVDVSMYSLGFAFTAVMLYMFRQVMRTENILEQQFTSVSYEQLAIIRALAGDFYAIYYVEIESGAYDKYVKDESETGLVRIVNSNKDWFQESIYYGKSVMSSEDIDRFLLNIEKNTLLRNLDEKKMLSYIFKIKYEGELKYFEYRLAKSQAGDRLVLGIFNIDKEYRAKLKEHEKLEATLNEKTALEQEATLLDMAAHRDIMTGLFNRRAYEDHMVEYNGKPDAPDFVYISFDVNGLKAANDDLGHDAGDELIKGVAFCMKKVFGAYGRVYRHGGDEFSAMIHASANELKDALEQFEQTVAEWHGEFVKNLTVSYGYAAAGEHKEAITIEDLEKIADAKMYEYKTQYYARKGIDRRGQQEAYDALRDSYIKVLKVDLKNDSFGIIKTLDKEMNSEKGYNDKISEWLAGFAKAGNVHENDRAEYLRRTSIEYLRDYFKNHRENFALRYKRRTGYGFKESLMEIIPVKDFSDENQIVFLYVKSIDNEGLYLTLSELKSDYDLTVQILLEHSQIEFRTELVKVGNDSIYVKPYLREGKPMLFDISITDDIQCNLFAINHTAGGRIVWNDVELETVEEAEGTLYHIFTRQFNKYSRPSERRIHERTTVNVTATVSDMAFNSTEVTINDISDTGISFSTTEPLHNASDILNIKFDDTINDEQFIISTSIKIVRNYERGGKMYYGCKVIEPTSDYKLYVLSSRFKNHRHHQNIVSGERHES